jgi:hypothetical protein
MHLTRETDFNLELEQERAVKIPIWVILLHSSKCKLSRELVALAKATSPSSDKKQHLRRQMCFSFGQPLPTASRLKSVIPLHEVMVKDDTI